MKKTGLIAILIALVVMLIPFAQTAQAKLVEGEGALKIEGSGQIYLEGTGEVDIVYAKGNICFKNIDNIEWSGDIEKRFDPWGWIFRWDKCYRGQGSAVIKGENMQIWLRGTGGLLAKGEGFANFRGKGDWQTAGDTEQDFTNTADDSSTGTEAGNLERKKFKNAEATTARQGIPMSLLWKKNRPSNQP